MGRSLSEPVHPLSYRNLQEKAPFKGVGCLIVKWVPPSEVRKRTLTRPITDKQERKLGA